MRMKVVVLGLLLVGGVGCARIAQTHFFPGVWPEGLRPPHPGESAQAPLTPTVQVEPLELKGTADPEANSVPAGGITTSEVLTDLLVQHLRREGIQAVRSADGAGHPADYLLRVSVPKMQYTLEPGYPKQVTYVAAADLTLVHTPTAQVALERDLEETFEETVLLNTMTRLPKPADPYSEKLIARCVDPLMKRLAAGLVPLLAQVESDLRLQTRAEPLEKQPLPSE